jgi:uncharacterized protein (TIGR00269 family)
MKCRMCGEQAVINMRQHRLALCEAHFPEWLRRRVQQTVEKYQMFTPAERVLVAVSGGKDSLGLWDILLHLGYRADGLYIGLGIDGGIAYSARSLEKVGEFMSRAELSGLTPTLHIVDIKKTYGQSVPEKAREKQRGRAKPCALCGLVKRHEMNRLAAELGYDALATGHNLDDEAATLFGNVLNWQVGYLARQAPVLVEKPGLARKVKPLCRVYEREMAAYALLCGIDYVYEECPYAADATSIRYKELLNTLEFERPGAKQQFYLSFLQARQEPGFLERAEGDLEVHPCARCGQPTTAPGICAFCRLWVDMPGATHLLGG